ncbi:hypothetical protein HPB50_027005 [Hyalomma asiaticum]|uniref:Uncharacterized protein n=1 Tax=Hyalomma asiaticum TaxID=266040 RepID=A0ACB7SIH2_HYAAI|nr:hypothetical protein HPB50_027005 [Hyalomma asiaticum]
MGLLKVLVLLITNGYEEPPPELPCTELPQMWRRPRGQKIPASSVDDIDWRAARPEGVSNPLQSRPYEARKRPRSIEDVQEAAKQFAIEMAAHTKSSLLGHWKSTAPTKADSLFGDTCVGSLLWSQKPLVPHDFTTYLCPEIQQGSATQLTPVQLALFSKTVPTVVSCVGLPPTQQAVIEASTCM